jgi:hypothetical protein
MMALVSEKPERERPPTDDAVAARLGLLVESVERQLGEAVNIRQESIPNASVETVRLDPQRPDACFVSWAELGVSELILQVGQGGRWELGRDLESVVLIERIVRAVIDGQVTEVRAPGRSKVTVNLDDGTQKSSVGHNAPLGLIPIPLWRRRGRSVSYSPYRQREQGMPVTRG